MIEHVTKLMKFQKNVEFKFTMVIFLFQQVEYLYCYHYQNLEGDTNLVVIY